MKRGGLLDDISARAFGFDFLRAALAPASEYGDRVFSQLMPFVPGEEAAATARSRTIASLARALSAAQLDASREILRNAPDAAGAIARASMGDRLSDANFLELQRFFDACSRIDALVISAGLDACANDAVRACTRAIETGRTGKFGFYLADAFDDVMAKARLELERAQAEYDAVRGRATAAVANALGRDISGPEFIVMRADMRGQLPPGVRVVREAATYVLCELDADEATLAALERRDGFAATVAGAEETVRAALSSVIRGHAAALDAASRQLGEVDVLVAAARFTQIHTCVVPTIVDAPLIAFEGARFVPVERTLEMQGRAFTPISLVLSDIGVLTGPNMGGKSVALSTCGFVAMCAAYGIPIPARAVTCALFDDIAWLGVESSDEAGGLLSSFAREVVRLREVLERKHKRAFVALDEFARTTTPREGRALLVAVIARLRWLGVVGMAATHLGGISEGIVKHFAVRGLRGIPERPASDNLADVLATLGASMDYTIEEVVAGTQRRSDAIALASLLGLDDEVIASAYAALDAE